MKINDKLQYRLSDLNIDPSQFVDILSDIQRVETRKKYGLVWEEHPEQIERQLKGHFPVLIEEKSLRIENEGTQNFLIEGDNLLSLEALRRMDKKVDVIYIDPPYNTGNEFVYNDRIVNRDDSYRHSKWISFMEKRLRIARDLLEDDGVIFISIDENEHANLKLLMDEIFGEKQFITEFSWITSTKKVDDLEEFEQIKTLGANLGMFKNTHEYILAYRKTHQYKFSLIKDDDKSYISSRITNSTNPMSEITLKKGIRCELKQGILSGFIGGESEPIIIEGQMIIENYKLKEDVTIKGNFRNPSIIHRIQSGERVIDNKGQEFIEIFINKTGLPYTNKTRSGRMTSNTLSGYGDTSRWKNQLIELLEGDFFEFPKPVPLIQHLVNLHSNKNAVILDFFAGSGTTGHAVLELNKEDGGHRQFILCTNNEGEEDEGGTITKENGICRKVTYQRLNKVINGYTTQKGRSIEGITAGLTYLTVGLTPNWNNDLFFDDENVLKDHLMNTIQLKYHTTPHQIVTEGVYRSKCFSDEHCVVVNDFIDREVLMSFKNDTVIHVDSSVINDHTLQDYDVQPFRIR